MFPNVIQLPSGVSLYFSSFFFLCDIEGHIEDKKIKNSLEVLGLHCEDMHVLGVFISDKFRQK